MSKKEITNFFSNEGSRNDVRMRVVNFFSKEDAGKGTGEEAARYIYYVENLKDGNRVYLQRPANLHNGFDFLVCVENINYAKKGERRRNYPKHEDIGKDLQCKKKENKEEYSKLYSLLKKVFECHDVSDEEIKNISFSRGFPVDHIVKVIKWLFIEQDIRYWNYSGRNMTWNVIPNED
ncbi:DNA adenine methylase [Treponema pectinovorum]|uniref:DNA adenine methylase n=1 Tax=Treponema pectinovorum TaxID=164 RepID=UPI0011CB0259|nr:DNA adenine methylase [Treponema pectinovorum]